MTSIDGIELNINMIMPERYRSDKVAMSVKRTLGHRPYIFTGSIPSGQKLSLVAGENFGWLQYSVVQQLIDRANVVGASYELVHGGKTYQVMFNHEDGPAVDVFPFVERETHDATDYFFGTINLIVL